jgi:chromate transport protein ChrA
LCAGVSFHRNCDCGGNFHEILPFANSVCFLGLNRLFNVMSTVMLLAVIVGVISLLRHAARHCLKFKWCFTSVCSLVFVKYIFEIVQLIFVQPVVYTLSDRTSASLLTVRTATNSQYCITPIPLWLHTLKEFYSTDGIKPQLRHTAFWFK